MNKIETALLSVYDKQGIETLARKLTGLGVKLISSGGTARLLGKAGLPVREVSEITGFPEMLDGRVKTLHPAVHAGILARRDHPADLESLRQHGIAPIDLVVVNLYPFREKVAGPVRFDEALEEIDIGGVTLIRAAAKNFRHTAVVVDPADYAPLIEELIRERGCLPLATRLALAKRAFQHTALYEGSIAGWFAQAELQEGEPAGPPDGGELPPLLPRLLVRRRGLRYGENPHQRAALYSDLLDPAAGWAQAAQLQGKELSYNNYVDMDAAWRLVSEFSAETCACAIIKHTNPCGAALACSPAAAYTAALACDPESAFGSIIAFNREVDADCARELARLFIEVIAAPAFSDGAREILKKKKDLRLVAVPPGTGTGRVLQAKAIAGAWLVQDADQAKLDRAGLRVVTRRAPGPREWDDLYFGWNCVKHVKSNAIVLALEGRLIGVGAGQMSRIDSTRISISRCRHPLPGAVLASDAFIPFRDTVDAAAAAGITAIIQPGGSIRDAEAIAAADEAGLAMVFTGCRHFLH